MWQYIMCIQDVTGELPLYPLLLVVINQYTEGTLNMSKISLLVHGSTTNILTLLASSDILSI